MKETSVIAALTEGGLSNVAMQSGTYRVDRWSLTTFGWQLTPAQQAAPYSAPGYAFVWNVDAKTMEILGSLQEPMLSATSIVHGVLQVSKATKYFLGHQNGNKIAFIYLQLFDPSLKLPDGSTSTTHAFAQLMVERLS